MQAGAGESCLLQKLRGTDRLLERAVQSRNLNGSDKSSARSTLCRPSAIVVISTCSTVHHSPPGAISSVLKNSVSTRRGHYRENRHMNYI